MSQSKSIYNPQQIEEKWQAFWEQEELFQNVAAGAVTNPLYLLIAFPYPSGSGLHVGHVESKTALDIVARYSRMNGKDVFFPIGWDSFGLPAENYAIKTGVHPAQTTKDAIKTFTRQIKRVGISYDWAAEVATSHPGYYKWTQWIFLELYKKGLAYQAKAAVNWCPSCQTVLANEQVVDGHCERCDHEVIQKEMKQWFFKITEYKQELIDGLDSVDWPSATKAQQLNWIGYSQGANIFWQIENPDSPDKKVTIKTFTTRFDTIPGVTYLVVAPEFDQLDSLVTKEYAQKVTQYQKSSEKLSQLDRMTTKNKTGSFTGSYAINPFNGKRVPVYVSNYVIASYGTGAVMGMPGHDQRDFDFAQKFGLPQIFTTKPIDGELPSNGCYEGDGIQVNSGKYDGLKQKEAKDQIIQELIDASNAELKTQYKLRDWLISRQRYWGAPIPIVYDPEGNPHPVKEEHLPWKLPTDVDFKPTGESPLVSSEEFNKRTEDLYGKGWKPEYDTMDTFVDSSWYYMRYPDARNTEVFADKAQLKKWLPVDNYMIGPEHIVLHLLYSRFFTKALRDAGYLDFDEPFMKMRHQGMILGPDHKKMSKSKGNVINPDDIIEKFGADTLRVYEMFMGPIESDKPWDTSAVSGVYRFLGRVHRLIMDTVVVDQAAETHPDIARKLHQTIAQVGEQIPQLKFNTAIAALMELLNEIERVQKTMGSKKNKNLITIEDSIIIVKLLAPFAPFITDELFAILTNSSKEKTVHTSVWPVSDPKIAAATEVIIPVQVNGKVRAQLNVSADTATDKQEMLKLAKGLEKITAWVENKTIVKEIYVPGKIINLVIAS